MIDNTKRTQQTSIKTAETINQMLLLSIYAHSSRLRNLDLIIVGLRFHSMKAVPAFIAAGLPSYELDKKLMETMIKRTMRDNFSYLEQQETLALENRNKRIEFEHKLDDILAGPFPEEEYQAVCMEYPVSRAEYVAAERIAGMLLLPGDRFTIHAKFLVLPQPMQARIPEPVVLQWVADLRRELAAEGKKSKKSIEGKKGNNNKSQHRKGDSQ